MLNGMDKYSFTLAISNADVWLYNICAVRTFLMPDASQFCDATRRHQTKKCILLSDVPSSLDMDLTIIYIDCENYTFALVRVMTVEELQFLLDVLQSLIRAEQTMVGVVHISVFCRRQNRSTNVLVQLASGLCPTTRRVPTVRN
jgi:hypothetical protein